LRLSKRLAAQACRLAVVGTKHIMRAGATIKIDEYFELSDSLEDVSGSR
jgi:hypothetical protein